MGYMHHRRCEIGSRAVRVKLTENARHVRKIVDELFARNAKGLLARRLLNLESLDDITHGLKRVERYWTDQIR